MFCFSDFEFQSFCHVLLGTDIDSIYIMYMTTRFLTCHFFQAQASKFLPLKQQNLKNITYLMYLHNLLLKDLLFTVIDLAITS